MLAIFKTGGKQYSVKAGQVLKVEKLEGGKGDSVSFNNVLAVSDNSDHKIGSPLVKGAIVQAKILDQIRDKKIIVFKKRQRQNYRHTQGHRQYLTVLRIESIAVGDKKSLAEPKKELIKEEVKKEVKDSDKNLIVKKSAVKKSVVKKSVVKKKVVKKKSTEKKESIK